jgi:hypothetical protein
MSCVVGATGVRELTCGSSETRQVVAVRERRKEDPRAHDAETQDSPEVFKHKLDNCCMLTGLLETTTCSGVILASWVTRETHTAGITNRLGVGALDEGGSDTATGWQLSITWKCSDS